MVNREIIFNDVSLSTKPAQNHLSARNCFEEFIGAVGKLITDGLAKPILRTQHSFQDAIIPTLTNGPWAVSDWLCDRTINRDLRSFILGLTTKIPIDSGLSLTSEQEDALLAYEYRAVLPNGPNVFALGVALQTNHVVASVPTDPIWDNHQIDTYICESQKSIRMAVVDHVSRETHCDPLAALFRKRHFDSIEDAADFLRDKSVLFPNLIFSPDVDIQVLSIEAQYLLNAMAKLVKMNETVTEWQAAGSVAPVYRFQWRGESTSTMSNPTYRKARVFSIPSGGEAVFENHLDFSDRHRIHFLEDRATRTIIIGYIGDHLPTTKYH